MNVAGLLPFVLIAVVFWLLLIRPQRRRQMDLMATQRGIAVGDEVVLGAGIVGRVAQAGDEYISLEVDSGVHLRVSRQSVVRVLRPELDALAEEPTEDAAEEPPADTTGTDEPTDGTRDH